MMPHATVCILNSRHWLCDVSLDSLIPGYGHIHFQKNESIAGVCVPTSSGGRNFEL